MFYIVLNKIKVSNEAIEVKNMSYVILCNATSSVQAGNA